MERQIFTSEEVALLLRSTDTLKEARIFEGSTQRPFSVQKIVIDLTTARLSTSPYKIGFPYRSFYVQDATDVNVTMDVKIGSMDSTQSPFTVKKNDAWSSDFQISESFLSWSAQSGKSITIVFFTDAEFRSGSQISVTGGGVTLVDGSSSTDGSTNLSATTAAAIVSQDTTRKKAVIQNLTGADLYIGADATVTDTLSTGCLKVPADGYIEWMNTGALYGYSVLGGRVNKIEEF